MHVQGLLIFVLGCQSLLSAEYKIKRCLLAVTSQKMPACYRKTRKLEQKNAIARVNVQQNTRPSALN